MVTNACSSDSVLFVKAIAGWYNDIFTDLTDIYTDLLALNEYYLGCCDEKNDNLADIINQLDVLIQNLLDCCRGICDLLDDWIDKLKGIEPEVDTTTTTTTYTTTTSTTHTTTTGTTTTTTSHEPITTTTTTAASTTTTTAEEGVDYSAEHGDYVCVEEWVCDVEGEFVDCIEGDIDPEWTAEYGDYVCIEEICVDAEFVEVLSEDWDEECIGCYYYELTNTSETEEAQFNVIRCNGTTEIITVEIWGTTELCIEACKVYPLDDNGLITRMIDCTPTTTTTTTEISTTTTTAIPTTTTTTPTPMGTTTTTPVLSATTTTTTTGTVTTTTTGLPITTTTTTVLPTTTTTTEEGLEPTDLIRSYSHNPGICGDATYPITSNQLTPNWISDAFYEPDIDYSLIDYILITGVDIPSGLDITYNGNTLQTDDIIQSNGDQYTWELGNISTVRASEGVNDLTANIDFKIKLHGYQLSSECTANLTILGCT